MKEEKSDKQGASGNDHNMEMNNAPNDAVSQKILDGIDELKKMEAIDTRSALVEVKQRIKVGRKGKWTLVIQRVAAMLLLPLLVFSFWQHRQINNFSEGIVWNSITTPPTLRSVFTLPDGSRVWLNGNTTISYPTFFSGKERIVELSGEAYFSVAANKNQPFIVKAGKVLIEAVGTEFNCMAYHNDSKNETLLTEGKVNILLDKGNGRKKIVTLSPNELVTYDFNQQQFNVLKVDPTKYIAWKTGQIIFKNDALTEVLQRLERWYNVDFEFDPKLKIDYAFTGSFDGEELTQILNYIELTTPISFTVQKSEKDKKEMYKKTKIEIEAKL